MKYRTDEGAAGGFRAEVEARGAKAPSDLDALFRVYDIREIRNSYSETGPNGNSVPIAYDKAIKFYQAEHGVVAPAAPAPAALAIDPAAKMAELERRRKAGENLDATTELPPEGGAVVDLENYPMDKFLAQMKKPVESWTDFEVGIFKQVSKARGQSDEWVQAFLGSR